MGCGCKVVVSVNDGYIAARSLELQVSNKYCERWFGWSRIRYLEVGTAAVLFMTIINRDKRCMFCPHTNTHTLQRLNFPHPRTIHHPASHPIYLCTSVPFLQRPLSPKLTYLAPPRPTRPNLPSSPLRRANLGPTRGSASASGNSIALVSCWLETQI